MVFLRQAFGRESAQAVAMSRAHDCIAPGIQAALLLVFLNSLNAASATV